MSLNSLVKIINSRNTESDTLLKNTFSNLRAFCFLIFLLWLRQNLKPKAQIFTENKQRRHL